MTDPNKRLILLVSVAAAALLLLIYTLSGGDEPPDSPAVATAPASAPASVSTSAPVAALMPNAPPPSAVSAPPPPVGAPAPTPVASVPVEGLRLHGITSGGAIIGTASGRQRLVRIGQQVAPGVVLQGVGQHHAMLGTGSGQIRLTFQGVEAIPGAAGAPPAGPSPAERQMRMSRLQERQYATGTQPRAAPSGAVTGYVITPGAHLPLLRQAGLQEGDVLISVNGQNIDGQERLTQIPTELAGARSADIEYERNGVRTRVIVPLPRR